jgi:hypothetical protein
MGRVIRKEIVGLRCELRSCVKQVKIGPLPLNVSPQGEQASLRLAVELGWSLVLTPQLRSYCPEHADRVRLCTCRTNPDRSHLCVQHAPELTRLIRFAGEQCAA